MKRHKKSPPLAQLAPNQVRVGNRVTLTLDSAKRITLKSNKATRRMERKRAFRSQSTVDIQLNTKREHTAFAAWQAKQPQPVLAEDGLPADGPLVLDQDDEPEPFGG